MLKGGGLTKGDVLVCFMIVLFAFGLWRWSVAPLGDTGSPLLQVIENGVVTAEIPLTAGESAAYTLGTSMWNRFTVEDGVVCMIEANCKGEDCIHSGKISKVGQTIICLPHRVELRIVSTVVGNEEIDGVVG